MQIDDLHDGMKKVRREPGSLKRWGVIQLYIILGIIWSYIYICMYA